MATIYAVATDVNADQTGVDGGGGTGHYPVGSGLSFDPPPGSFSGQVTGIVCGCSWMGANLYWHESGRLFGSRSGFYDDVLWDDVVRTNDVGSADLGPPRTLDVADSIRCEPRAIVPGESLYLLTSREVYAMIPGQTFATASFPRKADGARGAVGVRAADGYGSGCVYGAVDGLWYVRKSSADDDQPDELVEMTKDNRGAWAWLLGSSPSTLVVRAHLGDVWCLNAARYLHLTRQGRTVKGEWADGRSVVDAASDPARGLALHLSDGSLAVVGPYPSDGGTDLGGTNGTAPAWSYSTGVRVQPHGAQRAVVHAQVGAGGEARVDVEGDRPGGPAVARVSGQGARLASVNLDRALGGGDLLSFTVAGRATDRVLSVQVELTGREAHRTLDRTL